MGIFDKFKKKQSTLIVPATEVQQLQGDEIHKVNLRKETFKVSLEKKQLILAEARVVLAIDASGSMDAMYRKGEVQEVLERLLPVALRLDKDKSLDVWLFDDNTRRMPSITEKDFSGYTKRELIKYVGGGTNYTPTIKDIVKTFGEDEPSKVPTYVIFITDGDTSNHSDVRSAIKNASKYNIFWQFIGIGNLSFDFLKVIDTLTGRVIDNASFFPITNLKNITDEQLYDLLLTEYPEWLKLARAINII